MLEAEANARGDREVHRVSCLKRSIGLHCAALHCRRWFSMNSPGLKATGPRDAFAAASSINAQVIWSEPGGELMFIEVPPGSLTTPHARGAVLVANTGWIGCWA